MNIHAAPGQTVIYAGATDDQVRWGSCSDPRGVLIVGGSYRVEYTEPHSWHTKVKLAGVDGLFNSVCFCDAPQPGDGAPVKLCVSYKLEKYEGDPADGGKLLETITGGDDQPQVITKGS